MASGGSVAKHQFLSDDWFDVVGKLDEEHGAHVPAQANVVVNLVITDTPFDDERQMHMAARDGKAAWGIRHADGSAVTPTTAYSTAPHALLSAAPHPAL